MNSVGGGDKSRNVSHYLLRPLRSYDEAVREQARRLRELEEARRQAETASQDDPADPATRDRKRGEKV